MALNTRKRRAVGRKLRGSKGREALSRLPRGSTEVVPRSRPPRLLLDLVTALFRREARQSGTRPAFPLSLPPPLRLAEDSNASLGEVLQEADGSVRRAGLLPGEPEAGPLFHTCSVIESSPGSSRLLSPPPQKKTPRRVTWQRASSRERRALERPGGLGRAKGRFFLAWERPSGKPGRGEARARGVGLPEQMPAPPFFRRLSPARAKSCGTTKGRSPPPRCHRRRGKGVRRSSSAPVIGNPPPLPPPPEAEWLRVHWAPGGEVQLACSRKPAQRIAAASFLPALLHGGAEAAVRCSARGEEKLRDSGRFRRTGNCGLCQGL